MLNIFSYCSNLNNVVLGNGVTYIYRYAFAHCSKLTSISIGKSVTYIEPSAFIYCSSLTTISVASGNTKYDSRDNCNAIIETESNTIIVGCANTVIPNSVTNIGSNAFYGCTELKSITFSNSITSINNNAFQNCTNLKYVVLPISLTSILNGAFYGCSGLKRIYCKWTTPPDVNSSCFDNSNTTLYIPKGTINEYKSHIPWKYFNKIVEYEGEVIVDFEDEDENPDPTPLSGQFILMNHNMPAVGSQETVELTGLTSKITKSAGEKDASWLTVTQVPYTSGTPKVTLKTQDNTNTASRSSFIVFVAARDTVALRVIQAGYSGQGENYVDNPSDTQTDQPAYVR